MANELEHVLVGDILNNRNRDEIQKDLKFSIDEPFDESVVQAKPITGLTQLFGAEDSVATVTRATTAYATQCDRCTIDIVGDLEVDLTQEFALDPKDDELLIQTDLSINVWVPLRQELLVSMPLKKLCRNDCKGLCPVCGKNLNTEPHEHEQKPDDMNPFAQLKKLKKS